MNRLNRRMFIRNVTLLGASTAGLTLFLSACGLLPYRPKATVPRIGYLAPGPRESRTMFVDAFLAGMRDLGYVEGQTMSIDWRFTPTGTDARFVELAAELARLPVDVIVASTTPPSRAARQATSTIPIVAVAVAWPVETGLVASLARPGGNLTALSANAAGSSAKQVELLHDVVPGLSHAAVLVDAASPAQAVGWNEIRTAADQLGLQADRIDLRSADDLEAAFEAIVSGRADAFVDAQNPLLLPVRERFAALAQQHHLPGIVALREYVVTGLLMSYTPNFLAIHRRAAVLVDKILKGAKPADLPVEQPNTVDLVVNVKTLQALGLTIPPTVLPLVTEWIQ